VERTPANEVHSAFVVSLVSVVWTLAAGGLAIALGVAVHSAVLVAFGAIGFVDAAGSVALVYHFHHAIKHDALAAHLELLAHRVVVTGLFLVGLGAVVVGSVRLATGSRTDDSFVGTLLAAVSLVVLAVLSARKQRIAARVGSRALLADGRLSAVGAAQAAVALFGTAARGFGWPSADAIAATIVGLLAMTTAIVTRHQD
jgi:divalent metal cation (Fe/Co/Zn/Cd) transporter